MSGQGRTVPEPLVERETGRVQYESPAKCMNCGAGIKDAGLAPYPCPLCGSGPLIRIVVREPSS